MVIIFLLFRNLFIFTKSIIMKIIEDLIKKETLKRQEALKDLYLFMKNTGRFSVLVLGERGTGKTKWIKEFQKKLNEEKIKWCNNIINASCASFGENDLLAESELFGYDKGAYTGANPEGKDGLFLKANKGILFLDEIHHLSLAVQAKLLTALQTESTGKNKGKFPIRKIHSSNTDYVEVRIIFSSNITIEKLKERLLPDFFDRIAQLVVELPPLEKDENSLKRYFELIFENMDQRIDYTSDSKKIIIPNIKEFYEWLPTVNLQGNFRDLEKIAILWGQFALKYNKDSEIFKTVKKYYEYSNPTSSKEMETFSFTLLKTYPDYLKQFNKQYAEFISKTNLFKKTKQNETIKEVGRTKKCIQDWLK